MTSAPMLNGCEQINRQTRNNKNNKNIFVQISAVFFFSHCRYLAFDTAISKAVSPAETDAAFIFVRWVFFILMQRHSDIRVKQFYTHTHTHIQYTDRFKGNSIPPCCVQIFNIMLCLRCRVSTLLYLNCMLHTDVDAAGTNANVIQIVFLSFRFFFFRKSDSSA